MARIVDSTGTDWALMAAKDSVGRVYIRAYRNAWDVEKKRSYVQAKIQVGRLLEDGRIRLSMGFIERFPSYAEGEWYWGDKELVSETQFEEQFSPPPAQPDTSWSDSNIQVGQTWLPGRLPPKPVCLMIFKKLSVPTSDAPCWPLRSTNWTAAEP